MALICHSLNDEEVIVHTLNDIGDEYNELAVVIGHRLIDDIRRTIWQVDRLWNIYEMRRNDDRTNYHSLSRSKIKKKRATQVIRTSTNDWLTCLLDTWVTHKHIILSYTINLSITMATSTTIKVVTSITISSLGVVTIITNKESFPNFVIKSDTQQKSIDLNWGLLLHSIDLKQTIGL